MEKLHLAEEKLKIRNYGTMELMKKTWVIKGEPHMLMMLKRLFPATGRQFGVIKIEHSMNSAESLIWFMQRFPLRVSKSDWEILDRAADKGKRIRESCAELASGTTAPLQVETILPLRSYQLQAVHMLLHRGSLLCGDDLGLGKTSVGLGAIAAGARPGIIVCKTHLQQQWVNEAHKFLKGVRTHIVKKTAEYKLPPHNMLVITYSKLASWAERLSGMDYQLIVFDEVQELRIQGTQKYLAARCLCDAIPNKLGLSATPIYNYGDEIFSVVDLLEEGILGSRNEFLYEWCQTFGMRHKVVDPVALGSFLKESHLFIRRRRSEVGRELPPITKISEEVEHDASKLLSNEHKSLELARTILRGSWNERGKAALELDAMLRMQTGLAKAPYVAEFVSQLVESGEQVVLCGWHREVYSTWKRIFAEKGIPATLYTGSESPIQKNLAAQNFIDGKTKVLILSLRSGEGLNGLQHVSNMIVFGELDWSPKVHDQCIGRLARDGQKSPVTAVYLYAGGGSDPVIAGILGVKNQQSEGIVEQRTLADVEGQSSEQVETSRAYTLAKAILSKSVKISGPEVKRSGY